MVCTHLIHKKSARTTHWLMRCGRFGMEQRITSKQVRFSMKVPNFVTLYIHSNSNMPRSLNIFTWPPGHTLCHLSLLLSEVQKAGAFFHSSYFVRSCHVRTSGTAVPLCKCVFFVFFRMPCRYRCAAVAVLATLATATLADAVWQLWDMKTCDL